MAVGEIILGNVSWDNSYHHILDIIGVSNANRKTKVLNNMKINATQSIPVRHIQNLSIIKLSDDKAEVSIDTRDTLVDKYNYCMFRNDYSSSTSGWRFAFINSFYIESPHTVHLNLDIDLWINYCNTIKFKDSFIQRMTVPKSTDTVGRWLAPEPVNPPFTVGKNIASDLDTLNWKPKFVFDTLSKKINADYGKSSSWEYGGASDSNGEAYTPYYTWSVIDDVTPFDAAKELLDYYTPPSADDALVDHREDIIAMRSMPTWLHNKFNNAHEGYGFTIQLLPTLNATISNIKLSTNHNSLACGYEPKNKKMLTCLANKYIIYNRNGFKWDILKELVRNDDLTLSIRGMLSNSSIIEMVLENYKNEINKHNTLAYDYSSVIGYNANSGGVQQLAKRQALIKAASDVTTGALALGGAAVAAGVTGGASLPLSISAMSGAETIGLASMGINTIGNLYNDSLEFNKAYSAQSDSVGQNAGDSIILQDNYIKLRYTQISPLLEICKEIDEYLTVYGYAINRILSSSNYSYLRNRNKWDFLQGDIQFDIEASNKVHKVLKQMFANGVTCWHTETGMLDYDVDNG